MVNSVSSSTVNTGSPPGGITLGSATASSIPSEMLVHVLDVSELLGV